LPHPVSEGETCWFVYTQAADRTGKALGCPISPWGGGRRVAAPASPWAPPPGRVVTPAGHPVTHGPLPGASLPSDREREAAVPTLCYTAAWVIGMPLGRSTDDRIKASVFSFNPLPNLL